MSPATRPARRAGRACSTSRPSATAWPTFDGDIRDSERVHEVVREQRPEILVHMAAQPLVRRSYVDPVGTYATNVMGTVNVLDAARRVDGVRVVINVTTDKVYQNREWEWGYREDEPKGGRDPYSNSKALLGAGHRPPTASRSSARTATSRSRPCAPAT